MPEPLIFRTRRDIRIYRALVATVGMAYIAWTILLPLRRVSPALCLVLWCVGGATLAALTWWAAVAKGSRLTLDSNGLKFQGLLYREEFPWTLVEKVLLPPGRLFGVHGLVFKLRRAGPSWWSLRVRHRDVFFLDLNHWDPSERLAGDLLGRLPQETLHQRVRDYLAAPHRVAWYQRLPCLVLLALGAVAAGFVSVDPWLQHVSGVGELAPFLGVFVWYVLVFGLAGSAGPLDREWRWKSVLVRTGGSMVAFVYFAYPSALAFGIEEAVPLTLAACSGWLAVTFLVCLPIRPRARRTALAYAVVVALCVGAAWKVRVREPFPCRSTAELSPGPEDVAWSPDGRWLCGAGVAGSGKGPIACYVVDTASLRVRTIPFEAAWAPKVLVPDSSHALVRVRRREGETDSRDELCLLDAATGRFRQVHTARYIRIGPEGTVSPDGREVVFHAGQGDPTEPYVLRLADASVRKIEMDFDLSHLLRSLWRADGKLMLVASQRAQKKEELSFWTLAPGEKKPTSFYRTAGWRVGTSLSPTGRWALVGVASDGSGTRHCEIVDLLTGKARALAWPFPNLAGGSEVAWSRDGEAAAYVAVESWHQTLMFLRAATGEAARLCSAKAESIAAMSLSREGRYVACSIGGLFGARLHIIETATGRAIAMAGAAPPRRPLWAAWSPVEHVLAAARPGGLLLPGQPVRVRFYDLAPR